MTCQRAEQERGFRHCLCSYLYLKTPHGNCVVRCSRTALRIGWPTEVQIAKDTDLRKTVNALGRLLAGFWTIWSSNTG